MILYGQSLVNTVREFCEKSKKRIYIISPFIGSWTQVQRILGTKWIYNVQVEKKLITDIRNSSHIDQETFNKFRLSGEIRTLDGIHAKLYIFDESAILTSANLTGAAFERRHELGFLFKKIPEGLEILFQNLWKISPIIDPLWKPIEKKKKDSREEPGSNKKLKKLWELPELPQKIRVFKEYEKYLNAYNNFKIIYIKKTNRLLKELSVLHEIDAFFDFLFHKHDKIPSKKYLVKPYRPLSDLQHEREIEKYVIAFKNWLNRNPNTEDYRLDRIKIIQGRLNEKSIDLLDKADIEAVVKSLHCMKSFPLNKTRFLNPLNNSADRIINEWNKLLHNKEVNIIERMEECKKNLAYFGKSSIQELISWFYPDKYPMINRNSNSGLRFFGYDVKVY